MKSNVPRLTEDDREIIEGEIAFKALAAVRAMKSNKSPGSDG